MKYETFFIWVLSWQVSIRSVEPLGNSLNNFLYKRLLRTIWYCMNSTRIFLFQFVRYIIQMYKMTWIISFTKLKMDFTCQLICHRISTIKDVSPSIYTRDILKTFFPCACWRNFIIHLKSFLSPQLGMKIFLQI